jgi:hypothetical protein
LNGLELAPPSADEAELVVAVASGHLELGKLCERLVSWTYPR